MRFAEQSNLRLIIKGALYGFGTVFLLWLVMGLTPSPIVLPPTSATPWYHYPTVGMLIAYFFIIFPILNPFALVMVIRDDPPIAIFLTSVLVWPVMFLVFAQLGLSFSRLRVRIAFYVYSVMIVLFAIVMIMSKGLPSY